MKRLISMLAIASSLFAGSISIAAQQELTGVWQGKLAVDDKTSLAIQFTFGKDAKGVYTATLDSPDNPALKNTAASDVSFDGSIIKLKVASLSGAYEGVLKDGKITGQWTQPGGVLPLALSPFQKPVLSKATIDTLAGTWSGPVKIPGGELTFVLRFKSSGAGELQATLAVPEQGGRELPISDIEFADNKLVFKVPVVSGVYTANLVNGQMVGAWKQGGNPPDGLPATLKKGEYVVPVHALKLTTEQFKSVAGKWNGKLELTNPQGQKVSLTLVVRFETNKEGQAVAYMDSPDQKAMNIPVTEATFADGKLTAKVGSIAGEFTGSLTGNTLTGNWSQGGAGGPLVLTR